MSKWWVTTSKHQTNDKQTMSVWQQMMTSHEAGLSLQVVAWLMDSVFGITAFLMPQMDCLILIYNHQHHLWTDHQLLYNIVLCLKIGLFKYSRHVLWVNRMHRLTASECSPAFDWFYFEFLYWWWPTKFVHTSILIHFDMHVSTLSYKEGVHTMLMIGRKDWPQNYLITWDHASYQFHNWILAIYNDFKAVGCVLIH